MAIMRRLVIGGENVTNKVRRWNIKEKKSSIEMKEIICGNARRDQTGTHHLGMAYRRERKSKTLD